MNNNNCAKCERKITCYCDTKEPEQNFRPIKTDPTRGLERLPYKSYNPEFKKAKEPEQARARCPRYGNGLDFCRICGMSFDEISEKIRKDILQKISKMIAGEIRTAKKTGEPTARLRDLYDKINPTKPCPKP